MLIDLDVAPPPSRPRPRRDWGRGLKPVLLAALLLLVGGAASPARTAVIVQVADTRGVSVIAHLLTPDVLYVARPRVYGSVIEAIPLAAGEPGWTVNVPASLPMLSRDVSGKVLVVEPRDEGQGTFLDARTGRELWRAPQYSSIRVLGDRVAVWTYRDDWGRGLLRMAEVTSGRTLWQRPAEPMTMDGVAGRWLVTVDDYGRGSVYETAGGKVLADGRDVQIDPDDLGLYDTQRSATEAVVGDTLYWWTPTFVSAYRLPALKKLWRVEVADPSAVVACGSLACALGPAGITAVDPASGKTRWHGTGWKTLTGDVATTGIGRAARLDLATGKVVEELGRGAPAGDLLLRFERDRSWATGLADRRVIGVLPLVFPTSCDRVGPYLACPTAGQTVTVWRIGPSS